MQNQSCTSSRTGECGDSHTHPHPHPCLIVVHSITLRFVSFRVSDADADINWYFLAQRTHTRPHTRPASAVNLVNDPDTIKQTGMRPIPSTGQAPMIKRYEGEWENLFLNTGYGYNGYDLSWFASMCTVDWLKTNTHNLDRCKEATAIGQESSVWIGWYFILIITFLVLLVTLILCACYPVCYFCTTKGCLGPRFQCYGFIDCCYGRLCPCCTVERDGGGGNRSQTTLNEAYKHNGNGQFSDRLAINGGGENRGGKTDTMSSNI